MVKAKALAAQTIDIQKVDLDSCIIKGKFP